MPIWHVFPRTSHVWQAGSRQSCQKPRLEPVIATSVFQPPAANVSRWTQKKSDSWSQGNRLRNDDSRRPSPRRKRPLQPPPRRFDRRRYHLSTNGLRRH